MAGNVEDLSIDLIFGRMDTPDQEQRVKKIYTELEAIRREWDIISPAPAFKLVKDTHGQVHIRMNERMLMHLLTKLSELESMQLETAKPDDPPAWFMALMGNEPYEHLLPPGGATIE